MKFAIAFGVICTALLLLLSAVSLAIRSRVPSTSIDFIHGIGVNTHLSYLGSQYKDTSSVKIALQYLGTNSVRDYGLPPGIDAPPAYAMLAEDGVHFDMMIFGWKIEPTVISLSKFRQRYPQALSSVEGPNEVNNFPVHYRGETGRIGAMHYQNALFEAVRSNSTLSGIPIYNLSSYPPLYGRADYANVHSYAKRGEQPFWQLLKDEAEQRAVLMGKPAVLTETGYYTLTNGAGWGGVDERTQAILTLNTILDAKWLGMENVYLYQLFDEFADPTGRDQERHFGLFDFSGRPKAAASAIHNLTSILSDASPDARGLAPQPCAWRIGSLPAGARTLLLAGSEGKCWILLWNEPAIWDDQQHIPLSPRPANVTIALPRTARDVAIYDPIVSSQRLSQAQQSVSVQLAADPMVVGFVNAKSH